jgi:hypothetical protein
MNRIQQSHQSFEWNFGFTCQDQTKVESQDF